jgi:hypothetical protein
VDMMTRSHISIREMSPSVREKCPWCAKLMDLKHRERCSLRTVQCSHCQTSMKAIALVNHVCGVTSPPVAEEKRDRPVRSSAQRTSPVPATGLLSPLRKAVPDRRPSTAADRRASMTSPGASIRGKAVPTQPPVLGFNINEHCIVIRVVPNGPAAEAGILEGDRVVQFNGRILPSREAFAKEMSLLKPGDVIDLTTIRGGTNLMVRVKARRPSPSLPPASSIPLKLEHQQRMLSPARLHSRSSPPMCLVDPVGVANRVNELLKDRERFRMLCRSSCRFPSAMLNKAEIMKLVADVCLKLGLEPQHLPPDTVSMTIDDVSALLRRKLLQRVTAGGLPTASADSSQSKAVAEGEGKVEGGGTLSGASADAAVETARSQQTEPARCSVPSRSARPTPSRSSSKTGGTRGLPSPSLRISRQPSTAPGARPPAPAAPVPPAVETAPKVAAPITRPKVLRAPSATATIGRLQRSITPSGRQPARPLYPRSITPSSVNTSMATSANSSVIYASSASKGGPAALRKVSPSAGRGYSRTSSAPTTTKRW